MNSEQQEEHQADAVKVSLGQRLKSAREVQGLSVKDVADNLRLRVSVIEEIERDRFNSDNIPTYTRGYIRSYAKLLSIGTESLLKECQLAHGLQSNVTMQSFSRKTSRRRSDNRLMNLTWAILSFVVGITFIWGWQFSQKQVTEEKEVTEINVVKADTKINTNLIQNVQSPADITTTTTTSSDTQNTSTNKIVPSVSAETVIPSAEKLPTVADFVTSKEPITAEPILKKSLLSMNFIADCWVDIRDGNGKRLLTGIKSRGESVELDGKEPFKIVLGAPSAVELTYKGEDIDLSGYPPKRVARLTLPQK